MKWLSHFILFLLCICFIMSTTACGNSTNRNESESSQISTNNSQVNLEFKYPAESDFVFSVKPEKTTSRKGEDFVIDCILTNNTDADFYIESGEEVITYSYNDFSENIDQIAVLSTFKSKSEINRTLAIEASSSGIITVTATLRIKPNRYSDSFKVYTYTEKINVTVE